MAFSSKEQAQVLAALKYRDVLRPCRECDVEAWAMVDGLVMVYVQETSTQVSSEVIPSVTLICQNCGAVRLHSLLVLGLKKLLHVPTIPVSSDQEPEPVMEYNDDWDEL